ncbi:MAG: helix-turn-helix transcriptional regulator [Pseudomonadales bacterium]|nr:helix-turn-helix transcriptional regulator [Pseudomonadales bacterium]MCP5172027.1 helix-turn-helix transcriptional regulator [Pseudomonadales bacterium]
MRSQCALANGLEILGDRWTLLIVRDLMFTNRCEFSHFMQSGEGISSNILADRLERLVEHGVISKQPHPGHGKKYIYRLTDVGLKLAPTVIEFSLWAAENIEGAFVPPSLVELMQGGREKLLGLIYQRQTLIHLDL